LTKYLGAHIFVAVMIEGIKAIIFDLDGTLIDASDGVVECFNYALKEAGLKPAPAEEIKSTIGYPPKEVFKRYSKSKIEFLHRKLLKRAKEVMAERSRLLPGARETLEFCNSNGFKCGLATTKYRENGIKVLAKLEIEKYFEVILFGDEVEFVKPHPGIIYRIAERLEAKPQETLVVGDTINDVIAARAAGATSVSVTSGVDPKWKLLNEKPDYLIDTIGDLITLLS
jgi:HAD superfamily hydrolase (TIGR01549 family)